MVDVSNIFGWCFEEEIYLADHDVNGREEKKYLIKWYM
jgi:hypothetical protein